ncbi:extracellular solute-binding protein [Vibrio sp. SS-MA-C1-2]|uniref:ABC transporter substrate-binding protein n=1 Tax=Vibrio sp. SS-MA-C1-2 TaxID=2908646 RepID=UPI001F3F9C85|nr:extracellular solute-binding protein [Vibrio sp. SS-MA-C1-2]UJF19960.1 extracellular solute-binding protein [Vibrio sp. SS-MA-C1-2]
MSKVLAKGLLTAAVAMGCFTSTVNAEEITVWAWDPNFNVAIMEEAATRYEATHPDVEIKVVDFARENIEQKLHTMLASGVTSSLPDITLIEDYSAQKYLQSYPGSFASLSGKINYDNFAPYKVDLTKVGTENYGVPFDSGVAGLYYRTDILAQAGFKAEDLENITWQEFIKIGQQVKAKTGISMLGNNPSDMGLIRIMIQSAGVWYFNNDGSLNIENNAALKQALEDYKQLYATGITRATIGWSEWVGAANKGNVASMITGVWITPSVTAATDQAGKWKIAPVPRLETEGAVNASNLGGSSWYVLEASKEKATAVDFLAKTFGEDVGLYNQILKERGAVASYLPAEKTEAYQYSDQFFGGQKIYSDFSKWMTQIPAVNYGMFTAEVDAALAAQIPAIMQGMPIDKALTAVQQQLEYQIR